MDEIFDDELFPQYAKSKTPHIDLKFTLRENALKSIMAVKGWKTYQQVADATGYTRQYISLIDKPDGEVTHQFMLALAKALGSLEENWWVHFKIIPKGEYDPDHPKWNYAKYMGQMPYRKYSTAGAARSRDNDIEFKSTW